MLKDDGIILVSESPAAESFEKAKPAEASSVCISALHCLPVSRPPKDENYEANIQKYGIPEDIGNPFRLSQLKLCVKKSGFDTVEQYNHPKLVTMSLYIIS